jgi:hypothetical protein
LCLDCHIIEFACADRCSHAQNVKVIAGTPHKTTNGLDNVVHFQGFMESSSVSSVGFEKVRLSIAPRMPMGLSFAQCDNSSKNAVGLAVHNALDREVMDRNPQNQSMEFRRPAPKPIRDVWSDKRQAPNIPGSDHSQPRELAKPKPSPSQEHPSADSGLVQQVLKRRDLKEISRMLFSVYNFGGQAVYYDVHRLIISRFAVYLVVFNLEDFSLGDAEGERECLSYLRYWLTTIAGTCDGFDDSAPVLLVGTHKDSAKVGYAWMILILGLSQPLKTTHLIILFFKACHIEICPIPYPRLFSWQFKITLSLICASVSKYLIMCS